MLVESVPETALLNLGFHGSTEEIYNQAVRLYTKDLDRFISDFKIEEDYIGAIETDTRENYEYATPEYGKCNGTSGFPHDYQLRLKKEVLKHLLAPNNYNTNKTLVTMPTGAGKTILAMEIIVDLIRIHNSQKPINICWLVNSNELAEQSLTSFQKIWKQRGDRKIMAQRFYGKFNILNDNCEDKITFATFPLLTSRIADNNQKELNFIAGLNYLFIDEAHYTGAEQYNKIFKLYQDNNIDPKIVGLTATPIRSNDDEYTNLKSMFNHFVRLTDENNDEVDSPIEYLQKRKFLAEVEFYVLNEQQGTNSSKKTSSYYKQLHESVYNICKNLIQSNENTIIFAETKSHAIALSLYLKSRNIQNELIVGETPMAKRKSLLKKLGDDSETLNILVNEKILSTGIDIPGLNSIVVLADVESITTTLQILGRAMRGPKNGGNSKNTIYITKDNKNKLEKFNLLEDIALNN
jgi:superfamily II DNA or RNA helicase